MRNGVERGQRVRGGLCLRLRHHVVMAGASSLKQLLPRRCYPWCLNKEKNGKKHSTNKQAAEEPNWTGTHLRFFPIAASRSLRNHFDR